MARSTNLQGAFVYKRRSCTQSGASPSFNVNQYQRAGTIRYFHTDNAPVATVDSRALQKRDPPLPRNSSPEHPTFSHAQKRLPDPKMPTSKTSSQGNRSTRSFQSFFHSRGIYSEQSKFQKLTMKEGSIVGRVQRSGLNFVRDEDDEKDLGRACSLNETSE
mmetsp:Transcript_11237/g.28419  ORF Transcript_11237/g.28419 Transcript_11237/m.28419 type:complete len:161 (+) Transcript_11237:692-1174(+)